MYFSSKNVGKIPTNGKNCRVLENVESKFNNENQSCYPTDFTYDNCILFKTSPS